MSTTSRRLSIVATLVIASIVPVTTASGLGVPSNGVYQVQVGGVGGVPSDAAAAAIQVTVTNTAGPGYVTAYPCGSSRPTASNVNFEQGQTRSSLALVKLGTGGRVCLYSMTATDLVVDVSGWLDASTPWQTIVPERVLDTRIGAAGGFGVTAGSVVRVPFGSGRSASTRPR